MFLVGDGGAVGAYVHGSRRAVVIPCNATRSGLEVDGSQTLFYLDLFGQDKSSEGAGDITVVIGEFNVNLLTHVRGKRAQHRQPAAWYGDDAPPEIAFSATARSNPSPQATTGEMKLPPP